MDNGNMTDTRAMSALNGTKTEQNLNKAFSGEASAHTKYMLYADKAREEGYPAIARQFDETAGNEKEHAELWLGYMGGIGSTEDNLRAAVAGENAENTDMYPEMARVADDEGFNEIAQKFRLAGEVEGRHRDDYRRTLNDMEDGSWQQGDSDTEWACINCGFRFNGNTPPVRCPLCGYPREYFVKAE